jgi:hypothetical protein
MNRDAYRQNLQTFLTQFVPTLLPVCVLQPEQRMLVDELGMIRTEMGSTVDKKMVAVAWGALYDTTS